MQTVIELPEFLRSAKAAGMTEDEKASLINALARDPLVGISLGGGLRKVRLGRRGSGKSGGYRTIHFFVDEFMPIILITCFAKNQRDNISEKERSLLLALCAELESHYRRPT
jgi:hypothetical protein